MGRLRGKQGRRRTMGELWFGVVVIWDFVDADFCV
jgi:hypothetical protein